MLTLGSSHLASLRLLLPALLLRHVVDAQQECLLRCCGVDRCQRQRPQHLQLLQRWQPRGQTHAV
jgi:hypothetical protein